jgi:hypothetical protein
VTNPLEPTHGPRIEPPPPARRVERARRDQERGGRGRGEDAHDKHDEEAEPDEDTGLHVDVLA